MEADLVIGWFLRFGYQHKRAEQSKNGEDKHDDVEGIAVGGVVQKSELERTQQRYSSNDQCKNFLVHIGEDWMSKSAK